MSDDFCGFVRRHVCEPLAMACATGAVPLQLLPARGELPASMTTDDIAAMLRHMQEILGVDAKWTVQEADTHDAREVVVVARAAAAVPTVVKAAASAAGQPFRDVLPLRDALAESTATAITHYLNSDEHPFFRGLPAVVLRRRLRCRHVGNGALELHFDGRSTADVKAALPLSDALLKLQSFVMSRIASFAVDRGGELGFLPHAIAAGDGATGRLLVAAGVADSVFPVSLHWTGDDVTLDTVGDFTCCVHATTGDAMVPLSMWRVPQRVVNVVCAWAGNHGVTVSDVDVTRALRDDAVTAMSSFLDIDGARRVSLASHLRVTPSVADSVVISFAGATDALIAALQHVSRPELMTADEEASLRESEMLYSVLHAAVFKLQLPLAAYLREQLPLFFEACVAASDVSVTDPDDARHIANAVYRVAGLPGDPLDDDWRDGRDGAFNPVLSDGRCIVAADGVGGRVWIVLCAGAPLSSAVDLPLDDASLTADDQETARRLVVLLRARGVSVAMPSSLGGGTWLRPPRRRDNKTEGLRFHHLDRNKGKSNRDGDFDYRVRSWLDAAKLFLPDTAHVFASTDVYAWDMTVLIGAMERNEWLLRPLAIRASASVDEVKRRVMTAMRSDVRNRDAHMTGLSRTEFNKCMGTVIRLATLCGESPSSSLVTELMDMSCSPQSFSALPPVESPFPTFLQGGREELFVGHGDLLDQLMASLRHGLSADAGAGTSVAAVISQSQAISGLGGVGKSAIARELCRRLRRARYYRRGVFWIIGENVNAFQKGYYDMAMLLKLPFDPAKPNSARDVVFQWMRKIDRWLLVIDNVDDPELVMEFVPPAGARGHVVMTTRAGSDRLLRCGVMRTDAVVLDCLDAESSVSLLCQLCHRDAESLSDVETGAARDLCIGELGGLPLAIEQAGAYMRDHCMGLADYLELYRAEWQSLFGVEAKLSASDRAMEWQKWLRVRRVHDATIEALQQYGVEELSDLHALSASRARLDRALQSQSALRRNELWDVLSSGDGVPVAEDNSRRSVRTTWELSMRSLSRAHKEMVRLLCNFAADDIPVGAMLDCAAELPASNELRRLLFRDGDVDVTPVAVAACRDVVRRLSDMSLVKWMPSSSLASMHRLLQAVVMEATPEVERETLGTACIVGLSTRLRPLVPSVESAGLASGEAATMRSLLPHGRAVQEKWGRIVQRAGESPAGLGLPVVVRLVLQLTRLINDVAECMRLMSQFDGAEQSCRQALTLLRRLLPSPWDPLSAMLVAESMHNLGRLLHERGILKESEQLLRDCMATLPRECPRGIGLEDVWRPLMANAPSTLAAVLHAQGRLRDAVALYKKSLAMTRRLHAAAGGNHPRVARILSNLARAFHELGDLKAAEPVYDEGVAMMRRLDGSGVGKCSTWLAVSLHNRASLLCAQGKVEEAVALHRESLAIRRKLHGGETADHPDVATSLCYLAEALRLRKELLESETLHREALSMRQRLYTETAVHPDIAASLHNLGIVLACQNKFAESAVRFRESLTMLRAIHGHGTDEDHSAVVSTLFRLAVVLAELDELEQSDELHREALEMVRRVRTADSICPSITEVSHSLNDLARRVFSKAMMLPVRKSGDLAESTRLHRKSLALRRLLHGESSDHADIATSLYALGDVLQQQHDSMESLRLHRESLAMRRRLPVLSDADRERVVLSLNSLGLVLLTSGMPGDLAECSLRLRDAMAMARLLSSGHDNRFVVASLPVLSMLLEAQGDSVGSQNCMRRTIEMTQRIGM
jgi:tetratricopeptide (TPR) repeat protein